MVLNFYTTSLQISLLTRNLRSIFTASLPMLYLYSYIKMYGYVLYKKLTQGRSFHLISNVYLLVVVGDALRTVIKAVVLCFGETVKCTGFVVTWKIKLCVLPWKKVHEKWQPQHKASLEQTCGLCASGMVPWELRSCASGYKRWQCWTWRPSCKEETGYVAEKDGKRC